MLNRNITNVFNWIFDNLIPPCIRDAHWFMNIWFSLLFKDKKEIFFNFKQQAFYMTSNEFSQTYKDVSDVTIKRATDLNMESIEKIKREVIGSNVLDVGCGKGYLVKTLKKEYPDKNVVGTDIVLSEEQINCNDYFESFVENLSEVENNQFDTVVCTHVLEHVQDFDKAVSELRRIAAKRLIIVIPCQREYKYTFDLHLRFFPYVQSFINIMGNRQASCCNIKNDIYYVEDFD